MNSRILHGLRILNTRPSYAGGQARFKELVESHGAQSIECPLQIIKPLPFVCPDLASIDIAIFVSPAAVHCFFAQIQLEQRVFPKHINVLGMGSATHAALLAEGVETASFSSEGHSLDLLKSKLLQKSPPRHILWLKGPHGQKLLGETLSERQHIVHELNVYQSLAPVYSEAWLKQLLPLDIILLSSQQALEHLHKLFKPEDLVHVCFLVFSQRIEQLCRTYYPNPVLVCRHDTIIETLASRIKYGL